MKWIESGGGALVIIEQSAARTWRGTDLLTGRDESHYDLASGVYEEIDVVHIDAVPVLVLGDEPNRTYWHATRDGGVIVRWIYANSESELIEFMTGPANGVPLTTASWRYETNGPCIMFDSAYPGDEAPHVLTLLLSSGSYSVETGLVNPSPTLSCYVHRLRRQAT